MDTSQMMMWKSLSEREKMLVASIYQHINSRIFKIQIQLMGCKRISEKSVQILSIIPSIERIHVEGTSVGLVPSDWKMVMENDDIRDRKKEHNCMYDSISIFIFKSSLYLTFYTGPSESFA